MKLSIVTRSAVVGLAVAALAAPVLAGSKQNDPFGRPVKKPVRVAQEKPKESIIPAPALAARQAECKGSLPAGKQVQSQPCMYLVRELKLTGVLRSTDQAEAFLYAEPTKQSIVVRAGDRLYDGRVVSIQEPGPSGGGAIVLEKVTKKQLGKKISETKELVTLNLSSSSL